MNVNLTIVGMLFLSARSISSKYFLIEAFGALIIAAFMKKKAVVQN